MADQEPNSGPDTSDAGDKRFKAPELPDLSDLDERARLIGTSARSLHKKQEVSEADLASRRATQQADARGLGQGLQIAYTIFGFPTLGFVIGIGMDHTLHTTYWKGFIGLAGCVIAVVAAMFLIKQANRS